MTAYRPETGRRLPNQTGLTTRPYTELVRAGSYAAEVEVELIETDEGWSSYFSMQDALKIDRARAALRRGDYAEAAKDAKVFELLPLAG